MAEPGDGEPCPTCPDEPPDDLIPPTVTGVSPAGGTINVSPSDNVTATFSEDMDSTTITTSTFTLVRQGSSTPVPGTVVYDSATRTATLNPDANLDSAAFYTATVTTGAKDSAGNALDQDSTTTGDQPKTWTFTVRDYTPPGVSSSSASVSVAEGQTATNSGSYSDNVSGDVRITASRGTVTKTGANSGTWSWSQATDDGPAQSGTVTINATDASGNSNSFSFTLTVNNVAPTATFSAPATSHAGKTFIVSLSEVYDPSSADTSAGFRYSFDCGSGYGNFSSVSFATCAATGGGSQFVGARVMDKDSGILRSYFRTVSITAGPASLANGRIAYARSGEIYTMAPDGASPVRLTNDATSDEYPAFSPNGRRVAWQSSRDGNPEIYTSNVNGTSRTRITTNTASDQRPAFSPDGSKVVFQSLRDGNMEIYTVNADGSGTPTRLTNNPAEDIAPAWSPNGSQIAFVSHRDGGYEIYVANADGSGTPTRLTNNPVLDSDPSFSPDGSKIAFTTERDGDLEVYVMKLDGTGLTRITDSPDWDIDPAFSPDGSKVVFQSLRDRDFEIYAANADATGTPTRLTNRVGSDAAPSWGGAGDTEAPQTTITSAPADPTNVTSASFQFSSSEGPPTFECQLDGGGFSPCSTTEISQVYGKSYPGPLSEGRHTFEVRATDAAANTDPSPAVHAWTVDLTAPGVTGTTPDNDAPGVSESVSPTVTFSEGMKASSLTDATFTLTRQGAANPVAATVSYDAATRTATLNPTADLDSRTLYTANVRGGTDGAKDSAGNPLGADRNWSFTTADTRLPTVTLTAPAHESTVGARATFTADAADNIEVARVDFLVNGEKVGADASAPYTWNHDFSNFGTDGASIQARAVDTSGNSTTSDAHRVRVDNVAPETTLDPAFGPAEGSAQQSDSAEFQFSSEQGASFECRRYVTGTTNPPNFADCTSPQTYSDIPAGDHTFEVRAKDAQGNLDQTPAKRTWTVKAPPPDTTAPTVDASSLRPLKGATLVKRDTPVSVTFSEVMKSASLVRPDDTSTTFKLQQYNKKTKKWKTISATVALSNGDKTATLDPFGATGTLLAANNKFRATITTGAQDAAGNPLARSFVWTFTTGKN